MGKGKRLRTVGRRVRPAEPVLDEEVRVAMAWEGVAERHPLPPASESSTEIRIDKEGWREMLLSGTADDLIALVEEQGMEAARRGWTSVGSGCAGVGSLRISAGSARRGDVECSLIEASMESSPVTVRRT
jgi:hypothetical protein